jgi:hypothetical protein
MDLNHHGVQGQLWCRVLIFFYQIVIDVFHYVNECLLKIQWDDFIMSVSSGSPLVYILFLKRHKFTEYA